MSSSSGSGLVRDSPSDSIIEMYSRISAISESESDSTFCISNCLLVIFSSPQVRDLILRTASSASESMAAVRFEVPVVAAEAISLSSPSRRLRGDLGRSIRRIDRTAADKSRA